MRRLYAMGIITTKKSLVQLENVRSHVLPNHDRCLYGLSKSTFYQQTLLNLHLNLLKTPRLRSCHRIRKILKSRRINK